MMRSQGGRIKIGKKTPLKTKETAFINTIVGSLRLNTIVNAAEMTPKPIKVNNDNSSTTVAETQLA